MGVNFFEDYKGYAKYSSIISNKTITSNEELDEFFKEIIEAEPSLQKKADKIIEKYDDEFFEGFVIVTYCYYRGHGGTKTTFKSIEHTAHESLLHYEFNTPSLDLPQVLDYGFFFIIIDRSQYKNRDIKLKGHSTYLDYNGNDWREREGRYNR
ncbi:MAG: hypothetical protein FWG33_03765 [Oscillospiraceae bacterium]|nr:hypothetical protein [Oscillospiraceae bacterium]